LGNAEKQEAAWRTFRERYRPLILSWCQRWGLKRMDAEDICAAVLSRLVRVMRDFVYDPDHRFRGWLKTVVDNEVRGYWRLRARRPGDEGSGDAAMYRRLEEVVAPDAGESLGHELDETLERDLRLARQLATRVKNRVKSHTWQAFWRTAIDRVAADDVARELHITVAAVYMAKRRVGQMLRAEGVKLRGGAQDQTEGQP